MELLPALPQQLPALPQQLPALPPSSTVDTAHVDTAPAAKRKKKTQKKTVNDASDIRWETGWLEQPFTIAEACEAINVDQINRQRYKDYDDFKLQKFVATKFGFCEVGDGRFEVRIIKQENKNTSFVFIQGKQTGTDIQMFGGLSLGSTSPTPVITDNDITIALAFGRISVKHYGPPQGPLIFCGKSEDDDVTQLFELTVVEVFVPTAASQLAEEPQVLCHFYNTWFDENPYYVGSRFLSAEECRRNNLAIQTNWFYLLDDEGPTVPAETFVEMQSFFNVRPPARLDQGVHIVGLGHVWLDNNRFNFGDGFGDGSDTDASGTE